MTQTVSANNAMVLQELHHQVNLVHRLSTLWGLFRLTPTTVRSSCIRVGACQLGGCQPEEVNQTIWDTCCTRRTLGARKTVMRFCPFSVRPPDLSLMRRTDTKVFPEPTYAVTSWHTVITPTQHTGAGVAGTEALR